MDRFTINQFLSDELGISDVDLNDIRALYLLASIIYSISYSALYSFYFKNQDLKK